MDNIAILQHKLYGGILISEIRFLSK